MTDLDADGQSLDRIPYRVDRRAAVGLALQRIPGAYFSGGGISGIRIFATRRCEAGY